MHNAAAIAIARRREAEELRDKVNALVASNGGDKSRLSLLLVGKSAGAIQVWNAARRHYGDFDDFQRVALVLIDPHGAAYGDGRSGAYKDSQDLWWPDDWSSDRDFLRVYNLYQRTEGLTGASFPDDRVVQNLLITDSNVSHSNIPEHPLARAMIQSALRFVCLPRTSTGITRPFEISIPSLAGRDTVDGNRPIVFALDNFTCDCNRSSVHVYRDGSPIQTFTETETGRNLVLPRVEGGSRLFFQASCGQGLARRTVEKTVFLDYTSPTFESIGVNPDAHRPGAIVLYANRVQDDGQWNTADFSAQVTVDGTDDYSSSGTSVSLEGLADGTHTATMTISDGFGRRSDPRSTTFSVSASGPDLAFVRPRENASVRAGRNVNITIRASHPSGIRRVTVYLDRVSDDEFAPTRVCTINGPFGAGGSQQRACPPVPVVSSGSLDWSRGRHLLIAVALDLSGNQTTVERAIRVR